MVLVKGGRHPLQQLVVDTFIPNDTALGVNEMSAAVITGPNFSGKSVYMKQVGLLVFLAHVGSWIPCEDAIIGVCDRIFTRIESIETCTVPQSTFTIDLNQMTTMLRRCTSKSLLLIDEVSLPMSVLLYRCLSHCLSHTCPMCLHSSARELRLLMGWRCSGQQWATYRKACLLAWWSPRTSWSCSSTISCLTRNCSSAAWTTYCLKHNETKRKKDIYVSNTYTLCFD